MRKSICDFLMIFCVSSLAFKEREINKRILNDKIFDNVSIKCISNNLMNILNIDAYGNKMASLQKDGDTGDRLTD